MLSRDHPVTLREQLAAQLAAPIRSGELACGERLPSGRRLATSLGIHRNTVVAAYAQLDRIGLVKRRGRRGVFVRQLGRPQIAESPECEVLAALERDFAEFLSAQRRMGRSARELDELMARWVGRSARPRLVVIEPEPGLRRVFRAEIARGIPALDVSGVPPRRAAWYARTLAACCVAARPEVACRLHGLDPALTDLLVLRTASLARYRRAICSLGTGKVVALLTVSPLLRAWARELFAGLAGRRIGLACPSPERPADTSRSLRIADLVLVDVLTRRTVQSCRTAGAVVDLRVLHSGWIRDLARYLEVGTRE